MSDLNDAGVTRDDIYKQFTKEFGVGPQDVHINEGICREYGRYCYNVQGDVSFANKSSQPCTMVSAEQTVTNTDSIPLTQAYTQEAQFTKSAKVTVTHSSSISFGQDISIHSNALGIGVDNSYEFKIGNSAGSESTSSNTITISDTETVTVPPNHGMNLN